MARLADREDDVLRQLRQQEDVGDVGVERLLEQRGRLARGEQDDRRLRVLADGGDLVGGEHGAPRCMENRLQVAAGQWARAFADLVRPADHLDLAVPPEGVTELGEAFAAARDEDAGLLPGDCLSLDGHYWPP